MYYPIEIEITNFLSIDYAKYKFRKGKPTLIIGSNNTDDGQKSNGVGKSSLVDSISFAIAGEPATRKVKQGELVRNGEKGAKVLITLLNHNGKKLVIGRTIFKGAGSQICTIELDGKPEAEKLVEQGDRDRWIMNEIGVSKDDFFNFFMITKEKYSSFLATTDQKKKTIINRFSGAEKIDGVKPYIEAEVTVNEKEIVKCDLEVSVLNGKVDVYRKQIEDEKVQQDIPAKIEAINLRHHTANVKKSELLIQACEATEENEKLEAEITGLNTTELETEYSLFEKEKESFIPRENALNVRITALNKKITTIEQVKTTEKSAISKNQRELNQELIELKDDKAAIEAQLKGFITCPKCTHDFSLTAKFTIEEGTEGIEEYAKTIEDFELQISELDKKIKEVDLSRVRDIQVVRTDIKTLQTELEALNDEIQVVDRKLLQKKREINALNLKALQLQGEMNVNYSLLEQNDTAIRTLEYEMHGMLSEIKKLEAGETVGENNIANFEKLIKGFEEEIAQVQVRKEAFDAKRSQAEEWIVNFRNFKSHLANQSIQDIEDYTNHYLAQFGSSLTIDIEGYGIVNKKIKEEITIEVFRNGLPEGSYGKFSGGEKGRIDVAVICAIQTLINLNSTEGLEFIVIDEVLESLDSTGIENIMHSLAQVDKTVLIVTQNEVNVPKENTVLVTKVNKITSIIPQ